MFTQGGFDSSSDIQGDNSLIPAAITDTGCERELNEDRYAVIESASGLTWVVCDGMGGVAGGELAAQLAVDAIRRDLENLPERSVEIALRSAILEANRVIVLRRQNQAFSGMGTTVVALTFNGNEVALAHAGDSRAYLVRENVIQQLTTDHTLVQDLVEKQQIRPEEALSHPQAHILTRCIGSEPGLEVETKKFWIVGVSENEAMDYLLLCTDGLYSLVSELEIADIISSNSPQEACVQLVEMAKDRGGFDNITMAIIPIGGQLRREAPSGYISPLMTKKKIRINSNQSAFSSESSWPLFLLILLLSVLALVVLLVGAAFLLL